MGRNDGERMTRTGLLIIDMQNDVAHPDAEERVEGFLQSVS